MTRPLLAVLLAGCAVNARSYDSTLSPVQHRAVRALAGATITLGAQAVGVKPTIALLTGTVGLTGASKLALAVQHPERIGPWTAGDIACDLFSSAAVLPLWAGRHGARWSWRRFVVGGAIWGAGMYLSQKGCVP